MLGAAVSLVFAGPPVKPTLPAYGVAFKEILNPNPACKALKRLWHFFLLLLAKFASPTRLLTQRFIPEPRLQPSEPWQHPHAAPRLCS